MNTQNSPIKHSGRSIKKLYRQAVRALRTSNHDDALSLTQEIISRQEDHPGAHAVQFSSLFKNKKFESARQMGNKAAELNPKSVFILNNQACLELESNNPAPAAKLLESLIEKFGEQAQWLYNLGFAHELSGQYSTAISMFRRTLDQNPQHDKAAHQLAETLEKVGHYEEATQAYDYWRLINHNNASSHAQYIQCAANSDNISVDSLAQELRYWGDRFIPKSQHYDVQDIAQKQVLNIAFIHSNYIPTSWLARSVVPTIHQLANNGDHITVYCHGQQLKLNDNINVVNATLLSDADFARKVRSDQIDVIIDLCGMRKFNRQRALGLQLASKQFSWLAHQGIFPSKLVTPLEQKLPEEQQFFISKNAEPDNDGWPEKTFAGIGAEHGLSYRVIKAWAGVLLDCPEWQLHLNVSHKSSVGKLLLQRFSAAGVNRDRLNLDPKITPNSSSIALDNFSHNDPIALSDALLLGANLVSLNGTHFPGQQSLRLITQLEMDNDVNETEYEFIQAAVNLAKNGVEKNESHVSKPVELLSDVDAFAKLIRKVIVE